MTEVKFGGLDLAQRVDFTAFEAFKLEDRMLIQIGEKQWPHIDYDIILGRHLPKIDEIEGGFYRIHYDRTGVGDAVEKLISPSIRAKCHGIPRENLMDVYKVGFLHQILLTPVHKSLFLVLLN